MKAVDEGKILKRLKAGDEAALGWFIEHYTGYVSSIVHSLIGQSMGQADIEEVTADVFLAMWESREKLRPGKVRPWLSAVARNTALKRLRQCSVELPFEEDILVINSPGPETAYTEKELAVYYAAHIAGVALNKPAQGRLVSGLQPFQCLSFIHGFHLLSVVEVPRL